jgi:hypothetical protein
MWIVAFLFASAALVGAVQAQTVTVTPTSDPAAASVVGAAADAAESISGTAEAVWVQLSQPPQSDLARILLIVGGLVLLLAGWFVYEWIISIAGFLIGATTALALLPQDNTLLAIVIFLIGGVIGAALSALVYYIAVFLIGGYIGIAITQGIALALSLTPVSLVAVIAGFIIGGMILVLLSLELLIVFSAIVGAQMLAQALNLGVGWMLAIAVVGIVVQLVTARARGVEWRRRPLRRRLWQRQVVVG